MSYAYPFSSCVLYFLKNLKNKHQVIQLQDAKDSGFLQNYCGKNEIIVGCLSI